MHPLQCMRGTGYLCVLHIDAGMLCLPVHLRLTHTAVFPFAATGCILESWKHLDHEFYISFFLSFSLTHTHTDNIGVADINCMCAIALTPGSAAGGSVCWADGTPASSSWILHTMTAEAVRVCLLWIWDFTNALPSSSRKRPLLRRFPLFRTGFNAIQMTEALYAEILASVGSSQQHVYVAHPS